MEAEDFRRMGAQMNKSPEKQKREYHEMKLQFVVVKFLRWALPSDAVFLHIPNGGEMDEDTRKKMHALGEMKGASDLIILYRGLLIFIELKVRKNSNYGVKRTTYQSKDQKAFHSAVESAGAFYAVCRSIDDVQGSLTAFGVPLKARVA